MNKPHDENSEQARAASADRQGRIAQSKEPEWTRSLKRLYDSVVEEPMPDSFKDLLSKLDSDQPRR